MCTVQVGTHAAVQPEKGLDMTLQCDGVVLRIRHVWERIPVFRIHRIHMFLLTDPDP
jgi:hypothetical protein